MTDQNKTVTLNITVDFPMDNITKAVADYVGTAFAKPQYSNDGTWGYRMIALQVKQYMESIDLTPMIEAELRPVLKRVTAEVIAGEISREIKTLIRKRLSEGMALHVAAAIEGEP